MKIVAFLQNMWVRDPASYQRTLDRAPDAEYRAKLRQGMITYALFAGCLTGRRLRAAFGDWCDKIVWEEASPFVADNPRDYHPPDPAHIQSVMAEHLPDVVLCFTKRGEDQIRNVVSMAVRFKPNALECRFIACPHPAARQADVTQKLTEARQALDQAALARGEGQK